MDGSGAVWEFALARASEKIAAKLQNIFVLIIFLVVGERLNAGNLAESVQVVFIG
jgi:hypothetical protein